MKRIYIVFLFLMFLVSFSVSGNVAVGLGISNVFLSEGMEFPSGQCFLAGDFYVESFSINPVCTVWSGPLSATRVYNWSGPRPIVAYVGGKPVYAVTASFAFNNMMLNLTSSGTSKRANITCSDGAGSYTGAKSGIICKDPFLPPPPPPPAPIIIFTAEETGTVNAGIVITIPSGSSALLKWRTGNATSCTSTNWNSGGALNNTAGVSTGSLTTTQTYSLSCTGSGGTTTASVTVKIPKLLVCPSSLTLNPSLTGQLSARYFSASTGSESCTTGTDVTTSSNAIWSSNAPAIASVDNVNQKGLVTGIAGGSAQISVDYPFSGSRTISANASVTVNGATTPSGFLTGNNCSIPAESSACATTITWTVTNVTGGSIFRDASIWKSGINGNGAQSNVSVPHGTTTFTLYSGATATTATLLDTQSVTGSCASGSTWNSGSSKCVADPTPPPAPTTGNSGFREVTP